MTEGSATANSPGLREACGVFGIFAPDSGMDLARITCFALASLQHRGQESCGIATCVEDQFRVKKGMGLVNNVFREETLNSLDGGNASHAIGHCRYSTVGTSDSVDLAQPFLENSKHGPIAVAHNGTLTMTRTLRRILAKWEPGKSYASDSQMILAFLKHWHTEKRTKDWEQCIVEFMHEVDCAYSLIIMTSNELYAVRDRYGVRPLCIGTVPADDSAKKHYVIASESCALSTIGATLVREVLPGEIIKIDNKGITATQAIQPTNDRPLAVCVFEYVYFSRPDSILNNTLIHQVRQRCGARLYTECPTDVDMVCGVPDSSIAAAIGYAMESRIPFSEGLSKNHHVGRTFIQPDQITRISKVKVKYNVLGANIRGKRIALVDDSLVRGHTMKALVAIFKEAGAREVHVRIASPPVTHPCHMGVNIATFEELIANTCDNDVERIRKYIGADSLHYLSHGGMMEAVKNTENSIETNSGFCSACFTGKYPVKVQLDDDW